MGLVVNSGKSYPFFDSLAFLGIFEVIFGSSYSGMDRNPYPGVLTRQASRAQAESTGAGILDPLAGGQNPNPGSSHQKPPKAGDDAGDGVLDLSTGGSDSTPKAPKDNTKASFAKSVFAGGRS